MRPRQRSGKARPIIGIVGSGVESEASHLAYELGVLLAKEGFVLLTGGGGGIMEEASRGASEAGGTVVGILPNEGWEDRNLRYAGEYPNPYVSIPIFTGMSDARNAINVKTSDVVVALPGGAGTLSEIALALKSNKPVILLGWSDFKLPPGIPSERLHQVSDPQGAIEKVKELLKVVR